MHDGDGSIPESDDYDTSQMLHHLSTLGACSHQQASDCSSESSIDSALVCDVDGSADEDGAVDSDDDEFVASSLRKIRRTQARVSDDTMDLSVTKHKEPDEEEGIDWSDRFWWNVSPKPPLFGAPAKKGEVRGGAEQAGQKYGTGTISANDYLVPSDDALPPIKILPDDYHWLDAPANEAEDEEKFPFEGPETPTIFFDSTTTAVDMFIQLFEPASTIWMKSTNDKAKERCRSKSKNEEQRTIFKPWNRTTFLLFVAALLWMDVEPKSELKHYWSRDKDMSSNFIRRKLSAVGGLSCRTFLNVLRSTRLYSASEARFLGFSQRESPTYDNQHKCRPFLTQLYETFQKFRRPGRCLSIDESMMKFTGRCGYVQTIIRKPIKKGLKFFYCTDSKDGYVYNGLLYTGETMPYRQELGSVFAYVWNLMSGIGTSFMSFLDKGHILFLDRYFTSVPLLYALYDRKTYAAGTIRRDRKNVPQWKVTMEGGESTAKASNSKNVSALGKRRSTNSQRTMSSGRVTKKRKSVFLLSKKMLPWGAIRFKRDSTNVLRHLVWADSKVVHILYTHPTVATQIGTCVRRNKIARGQVSLQRPIIVKVFDENMGGVDLCDQLVAAHRRHIRTHVWYVGILMRAIHLCCVNVYANMSRFGNKMPMKDLKIKIAKGIFAKCTSNLPNKPMPWFCRSYNSFDVDMNVDMSSATEQNTLSDNICDNLLAKSETHYPVHLEGNTRKQCKMCPSGKKVCYQCAICVAPLHIKCFQPFHLLKNKTDKG